MWWRPWGAPSRWCPRYSPPRAVTGVDVDASILVDGRRTVRGDWRRRRLTAVNFCAMCNEYGNAVSCRLAGEGAFNVHLHLKLARLSQTCRTMSLTFVPLTTGGSQCPNTEALRWQRGMPRRWPEHCRGSPFPVPPAHIGPRRGRGALFTMAGRAVGGVAKAS